MFESFYHLRGDVTEDEARRYTTWAGLAIASKDRKTGRFEGLWSSRNGSKRRGTDRVTLISIAVQAWAYSGRSIQASCEILAESRLFSEREKTSRRRGRRLVGEGTEHPLQRPRKTVATMFYTEKRTHGDRWPAHFDFEFGMYLGFRAFARIQPESHLEFSLGRSENLRVRSDLAGLVNDLRKEGPEAEYDNPHAQGLPGIPMRPDLISGVIEVTPKLGPLMKVRPYPRGLE